MARPKKQDNEKQKKKIVIYTTEERKNEFRSAADAARSSESELGEQIIESWLGRKGGSTVEYPESRDRGDLTGPLHGADMVMQRTVDVPFSCKLGEGEAVQRWDGVVSWIVSHGSHFEFYVQARSSGFKALAGESLSGWFLALPVHAVCLDLGSPSDSFYNEEKALACMHLNRVDGVSAVYALKSLYQSGLIS